MKTKGNTYPFTLKDVSELLDLKFSYWSDRLREELGKKIDQRVGQSETGIIAEMDKRFEAVDKRFEAIEKRFDVNDDAHQEILGAIDETSDRKISKHCQEKHSFATS